MNKIFTHTYKIEIFKNGKFCWINHGWIEKGINDHVKSAKFNLYLWVFILCLILING